MRVVDQFGNVVEAEKVEEPKPVDDVKKRKPREKEKK